MNDYKSVIMSLIMLIIGAGCCSSMKLTPPIDTKHVQVESVRSTEIVKQIKNATVALITGSADKKTPYCAGVWMDNRRILTAAHCAEIIGRTVFQIDDEDEYDAIGDVIAFTNNSDINNEKIQQNFTWFGIVEKIDKKSDLALIRSISDTSYHTTAQLAIKDIEQGDQLHVVGHPIALFWSYTLGVVAAIRNSNGPLLGKETVEAKVIQVSAPIWVGNSGGGAFNTDGHLIGICSWITLRAPNIGFFIHRDEIKKFLN